MCFIQFFYFQNFSVLAREIHQKNSIKFGELRELILQNFK